MTATRLEYLRLYASLPPSSNAARTRHGQRPSSFTTTTMPPPQRQPPRPQDKGGLLVNVVGKAVSVVIVLGLSLTVFAYRRSLIPLYGTAPVELHLYKISWVACIIGNLLPLIPLQNAVLVLGALLCAMPNTSYWVAAYTGRLHDPVWGPVLTHLIVFTPLLALGVLIVRILQVSRPYTYSVDCAHPRPDCSTTLTKRRGRHLSK